MDLTAWQRISNRLLGRLLRKRARRDKELSDSLVKGSMPMMPEVYLATTIITSIAVALVCWSFVALFFIPDIGIIAYWEGIQDPKTIGYCFEWEYWNQDLIDPTKPVMGAMGLHTKYSLQF